jgi:quercetin dioxygenase-like cupin family protein
MGSLKVPAGEGTRLTMGSGELETIQKVLGEQTGGSAAVAEHVLAPKSLGSPIHTHHKEHEISCVLDGTITVQIDADVFEAGPGSTVLKPKGIPHAFWNAGDVPARFIEIFSPAGFEHYFEELGKLIPPDGPPNFEGLADLWARYDLHMDMASMPRLIMENGLNMPPGM